MSSKSTRLNLPYIQENQAQKYITHNEGMRILDSLTQLYVLSRTLSAPPSAPQAGDRYIVAQNATGAWTGHENSIADWDVNGWLFYPPQHGWLAWDRAQDALIAWDDSAWVLAAPPPNYQNIASLGIHTTADNYNRLSLSAPASLFNHDSNGSHQLKINKSATNKTASLLLQTGFSGRAEIGLTGSDDLALKTSADGSNFATALLIENASGQVSFPSGTQGLAPAAFGDGALLTADYDAAKKGNLFANGTLVLGQGYNYPKEFTFDGTLSPYLHGSVFHAGYSGDMVQSAEFIPVDPNLLYRLSCYIRQEDVSGDWSAYTHGNRHQQYIGLACFDADKKHIKPLSHMRYKTGGTDSLTTLAAPLTPGESVIYLSDSSGWNTRDSNADVRGFVIYGYRNGRGQRYDNYSRLYKTDAFEVSNIDNANNSVALNAPLSSDFGNPDGANGTWPIGTKIANTATADIQYKPCLLDASILEATDIWYHAAGYIGGIDGSGQNEITNFPPGTAFVKFCWQPNFSNRSGGMGDFPDTGSQKVHYAGAHLWLEHFGLLEKNSNGAVDIKVPQANKASNAIVLTDTLRTVKRIKGD